MRADLQLLPFQEEGVKFLTSRKHAILADEMGLGKTVQACEAARRMGAKSALIICPAPMPIKKAWAQHLVDWDVCAIDYIAIADTKNYNFYDDNVFWILNYELLHSKKIRDQIRKRTFDVCIIDEAHRLKSLTSARSKFILGHGKHALIARANYKWLLSGSIMPNRPAELFPALKTLAKDLITPYDSWEAYGHRYCGGYTDNFGHKHFDGASNIDELRERIQPFMLRREINDVYDQIPDVIENTLYIKTPDIGYDESDTPLATLRRLTGEAKVPAIVEYLKNWIEGHPDQTLLVFAYHQNVIRALTEELNHQQIRATSIGGEDDSKMKALKLSAFKIDDIRCLIVQITAGGEGIDGLQHVCNNVVFAELDWSAGGMAQALGRLRRIGQKHKVNCTYIVAENTLDEKIMRVFKNKEKVIDKLINNKEKATACLEVIEKKFMETCKKAVHEEEKKQPMLENQLERIADALEGIQVAIESNTIALHSRLATQAEIQQAITGTSGIFIPDPEEIKEEKPKPEKKQELNTAIEVVPPAQSTPENGKKKPAGKPGRTARIVEEVTGTIEETTIPLTADDVHKSATLAFNHLLRKGVEKEAAKEKIKAAIKQLGVELIADLDPKQYRQAKQVFDALTLFQGELVTADSELGV